MSSEHAAADQFALNAAPELLTTMVEDADRDSRNLESFRAAIMRKPHSPKRDFALKALDRMIEQHAKLRGVLGPCKRMTLSYLEDFPNG